MAHCPPVLLATSSYDGEIIVWNVVSGCILCRFISPPPDEKQHGEGDFEADMHEFRIVKGSVCQIYCEKWNIILHSCASYGV